MVTHYSDRGAAQGLADALQRIRDLTVATAFTLSPLGMKELDREVDAVREALRWFASDD